jgi:hypothetical protein
MPLSRLGPAREEASRASLEAIVVVDLAGDKGGLVASCLMISRIRESSVTMRRKIVARIIAKESQSLVETARQDIIGMEEEVVWKKGVIRCQSSSSSIIQRELFLTSVNRLIAAFLHQY